MGGVVAELRRKAEQCRRLAKHVSNPADAKLIGTVAESFEAEADALDAKAKKAADGGI
jgi:hypothetical protein